MRAQREPAGVAAFGPIATDWSRFLPRELPILVVDPEGISEAALEAVQRRREGSPFLLSLILPDVRSLAARQLAPAILSSTPDRDACRGLFFALSRGELSINGQPQANLCQIDEAAVVGIRHLLAIADGLFVRSLRERARLDQLLLDRLPARMQPLVVGNAARFAPVPELPAVKAASAADGIVIWAPRWSAQDCSLLAFALDELQRPLTCVCAAGPAAIPGLRAQVITADEAPQALADARLVFTVDEDPGPAIGFASLGFAVAAPSTSGADEYVQGVVPYHPWDIRSVLTAASDAAGSAPLRLRGDLPTAHEVFQALAAAAPPALANPPLVSLVVPTRNRRQFLPITLQALAAQDYPALEIVVVNDGVSVADLCAPFGNVRLFEPGPGTGYNDAYNFGIREARGKYVGIQPDDDPPFPDHVARLVAALEQSGAPIAHAKPLMSIVERNEQGGYDLAGYDLLHDGVLDRSELLFRNTIANTTLFRRELLEQYGFYDASLGLLSDYDLWLNISSHHDFIHVPRVTCELITRRDGSNESYRQAPELAAQYSAVFQRHPVPGRPQIEQAREEVVRLNAARATNHALPPQPSLPTTGPRCKDFVPAPIDVSVSSPFRSIAAVERPVVLLVSHRARQCGVHEYGRNIFSALEKSTRLDFRYAECSDAQELQHAISMHAPSAIVYNRNSLTMPWLTREVTRRIQVPQIGILHEVTQDEADQATDDVVDFHAAQDPTLVTANPRVFPTPRLLPAFEEQVLLPERITVGSFGFGLPGKGFDSVVAQVCAEFDEADVRLHIPFNDVVDPDGVLARHSAEMARAAVTKPGVRVLVDHDFFTREQLLDFCAGNSVNAFLYDPRYHRLGISSVIDYALAVRRPVAISKCPMFRQILGALPSIVVGETSLKQIIANGFAPLEPYYAQWSEGAFVAEYERILLAILERPITAVPQSGANQSSKQLMSPRPWSRPVPQGALAQRALVRELKPSPWAAFAPSVSRAVNLTRGVPNVTTFNRILDDTARAQYASAIDDLFRLAPEMMARKIPEANVQQGFIYDTVTKVAAMFPEPRILCVGSFEDSAAASLKRAGYAMTEIDPEINYDLETFCALPSTKREAWDIIFSTSVLEHVEDDERFMELVGQLLATGGIGTLTVDFDQDYAPGKRIPEVDYRMYTARDFTERLLPRLGQVRLLGTPDWSYAAPDFHMAGYNYTFATLTFERIA